MLRKVTADKIYFRYSDADDCVKKAVYNAFAVYTDEGLRSVQSYRNKSRAESRRHYYRTLDAVRFKRVEPRLCYIPVFAIAEGNELI